MSSKEIERAYSLPDSISNVGKFVFRRSLQLVKLAQADREFGRVVDDVINTVSKYQKSFSGNAVRQQW
jgi:hypothetical protein